MNKVPVIPKKEEVGQLARWARVAFAVRCAKRVQPIFERTWPDVLPEHITAIKQAISSAEAAAANAQVPADLQRVINDAGNVEGDFREYIGKQKGCAFAYVNDRVNHPAFYSLRAAYCAILAVQEKDNTDRAWEVCYCCEKMEDYTYGPAYSEMLIRHIRRDFQKLQTQSGWDNNTPVQPGFFDLLWDKGKEPDWDKIAEDMKKNMENNR